MRKAIAWLMIVLMALQCVAFAESSAATVASTAVNGAEAVRTATDIYMAVPSGDREMLVRVPLNGGDPICVDRAGDFGIQKQNARSVDHHAFCMDRFRRRTARAELHIGKIQFKGKRKLAAGAADQFC